MANDYTDYRARTVLTQSAACDDWDALNESLLDLYDQGKISVAWENPDEPIFYRKDDDCEPTD